MNIFIGSTSIYDIKFSFQNDIVNVEIKESEIPHERKEWGNVPFELRMSMLPLEVTASAMEGKIIFSWQIAIFVFPSVVYVLQFLIRL